MGILMDGGGERGGVAEFGAGTVGREEAVESAAQEVLIVEEFNLAGGFRERGDANGDGAWHRW